MEIRRDGNGAGRGMNFEYSDKVKSLRAKLARFMDEHVYPNERRFHDEVETNRAKGDPWVPTRVIEELKPKARAAGLWNLFLPRSARAPEGLSNLEYAPLCEIMGRVHWAPEVFNCSAPDAASSDATNIQCRIEKAGGDYAINGRKWWSSGAGDPRCKLFIVMGKTDPGAAKHTQQSMILVPRDAPGVKILRPLSLFGYDDAPHGHMDIELENVRVPASGMLLGEGRGFEIAQGRLGPGRIHHCMRLIGVAERALELMCKRSLGRVTFGKPVAERTVTQERIAEARVMIDSARLLVLKAAQMMDTVGNKAARGEIAMIKVLAPNVACKVLDWAIQVHGGGGMSDDFPLAYLYAHSRTLRFADGPDEVHRNAIAKLELSKYLRR